VGSCGRGCRRMSCVSAFDPVQVLEHQDHGLGLAQARMSRRLSPSSICCRRWLGSSARHARSSRHVQQRHEGRKRAQSDSSSRSAFLATFSRTSAASSRCSIWKNVRRSSRNGR